MDPSFYLAIEEIRNFRVLKNGFLKIHLLTFKDGTVEKNL